MAVEVRKWVTFIEEIHQRGRPRPRAPAAPGRRRGRAQEPVRGHVFRGHLRAHRPRRGPRRRAHAPLQGGARRSGRGVRQGRHRRRARRARARGGGAPPEVRRPRPRPRSAASRSCRRSRSAAARERRSTSRSTTSRRCSCARTSTRSRSCVPDAPGADELLVALAVTNGGRPHARVGGLQGRGRRRRGRAPLTRRAAMRTLITGLGQVVSGDIDAPLPRRRLDPHRRRADRGHRARAGRRTRTSSSTRTGTTAMPGLIDSHVHPVFGDFTPRQRTIDFIESGLHGGVTTMISAGEVHLPGRPKDIVGLKALAIVASTRATRTSGPAGVKVRAGRPDPRARAGGARLRRAGRGRRRPHRRDRAGLGEDAAPMRRRWSRWARAHGMVSTFHTGGPSIAGSSAIRADVVLEARPDIVGHVNGGTTSLSGRGHRGTRGASRTWRSRSSTAATAGRRCTRSRLAREAGALDRVILGNDAPSGTGRRAARASCGSMAHLASLGGVAPETVVCLATGNTARVHGLETGVIAAGPRGGHRASSTRPQGSAADTALGALAIGDMPGRLDGPHRRQRRHRAQPQHAAGRHGCAEVVKGGGAPRSPATSGGHLTMRVTRPAAAELRARRADGVASRRWAPTCAAPRTSASRARCSSTTCSSRRRPTARPGSSRSRCSSALAGVTRTIRLGTLVLVLPFRDPVAFAKEWATLDLLSGGRSILGVGVGWHEGEFAALRIPYRERGRADERDARGHHRAVGAATTSRTRASSTAFDGPRRSSPSPPSGRTRRSGSAAAPSRPRRSTASSVRHDPAGPAADREVRLDVGAALLRDGRDGRPRTGRSSARRWPGSGATRTR